MSATVKKKIIILEIYRKEEIDFISHVLKILNIIIVVLNEKVIFKISER